MIETFPGANLLPEEILRSKLEALMGEVYDLWPNQEMITYNEVILKRCQEQGRDLEFMLAMFEEAIGSFNAIAHERKSLEIFTAYAKYTEELLGK